MRRKTPLALMEQVVMVLVFALAAALCLQIFSFSEQVSRRNEAIDRAVLECQRVAELLKADEIRPVALSGTAAIYYDEDWNSLSGADSAVYRLAVEELPPKISGLGSARVSVCRTDGGEELFSLTVAWQEVIGNG